MRKFYRKVLFEIVPWNSAYVDLSHLTFLGNSLDFIWCFNFCTSLWLCTPAPSMFEGKTLVLLIILALESNFSLLSPLFPVSPGISQGLFWLWFSAFTFQVCFFRKQISCSLLPNIIPTRGRGAR